MIYPQNFEQKIGFDQIRKRVTDRCLSPLGVERVEAMTFSVAYDEVRMQLYQTHELMQILREEDAFPSDHFYDARPALKKIRVEGTYLIEKELFDLRRSLETINAILLFFRRKQEAESRSYPHLQALAAEAMDFPLITRAVDAILDPFGEVKDSASPELGDIRRQLAQVAGSISKTLNRILRSAQAEGLVDKEASPTLRDGRLTIPIAPALKRKLKGIVHDESATGKTVFIEPAEVVEANNRIRTLEGEEKREIVRILTALTDRIRPDIPNLLHAYLFLGMIDFIRAKALFALEIEAMLPVVENRPHIDWIRAIHPLLALSHRKQNKPVVVPLDIELTEERRILIISGPNAGGKSVLLKTVGLLQYMLQSGLPIPLDERSTTGIFQDIFLDIGDEQSIENDLSTYSSHLMNMKWMIKNAHPQSLILIDEFGAGTEPQIGGAIAEALLHRFNDRRSFGIITTHYQNLKTYAEEHAGVVNGAMLYDRNEMQPLFRLAIGRPGSSFAIEIARKIGLPEDLIAEVSEKVGQDYIAMDKYLQDIVRDKRYWESKRQHIRQQEKRLEELTTQYQTHLDQIENQRKELVRQAKADAERLLSDANAQIERTIRNIKEAQAEKEKTQQARQSFDAFRQSVRSEEAPPSPSPRPMHPKKKRATPSTTVDKAISVGDAVRIKGQQAIGEVLEVKGKKAVIRFGSIKTSTQMELLEKVGRQQLKQETPRSLLLLSNSAGVLSDKKLHFKPEIDLRGMRGDEALQAVMYYLDDAIQCNAGRVRILHGTGTGALRQIIRDYLKTLPGILSFQDEHVQFGGTGITVVELE
jgi:DNA mismatch repair protein MutS2